MAERRVTIAMILKDLFSTQAKKIGTSVEKLNVATSNLRKELGPLGTAFSVFAVFATGKKISNLASQVEELNSKFNVVFGTVRDAAQVFAEDLGNAIGRSTNRIKGFLAALQDTFVPLGFSREAAFELSATLTQLALDVASFTDKADADVLRDFQSAIVGNGETVRKYGIVLLESTIQQEAFNQGLDPKLLTQQQKVLLRTAIILKQTTDAQGDAAKTAQSFANQSKQLEDNMADLGVAGGQVLNEFLRPFLVALNQAIPVITSFIDNNKTLVTTMLIVSVVLGGLVAAVKFYAISVAVAKVATAAFNLALVKMGAGAAGASAGVTILGRAVSFLGVGLKFIAGIFKVFLIVVAKAAIILAAIAATAATLVGVVRRLTGEFDSLEEAIGATFGDLKQAFDAIFNSSLNLGDIAIILGATFEKLLTRIRRIFVDPFLSIIKGLVATASAGWKLIAGAASIAFEGVVFALKFALDAVVNLFIDAINSLVSLTAKAFEFVAPAVAKSLNTLKFDKLDLFDLKATTDKINEVKKEVLGIGDDMKEAGKNIAKAFDIKEGLNEIAEREAEIDEQTKQRIGERAIFRTQEEIAATDKIAKADKAARDAAKADIDIQIKKELDAQNVIIQKQLEAQRVRQESDQRSSAFLNNFIANEDKAIARIKTINKQIEGGIIFADQGAAERNKLQEEREAEFQKSLANLQALKEAATDTGEATFIDNLIQKLRKANETDFPETVSQIDQIRVASANAASGPLTDMFETLITGTASAKEAFKAFALAFIQNIIRMIAQMLALRAIAAVTGVPIGAGGGFALGANEGGLIPGRGPNKDTVPASLTRGEFVVRRSAVDKYGPGFLNAVNQGVIPKSVLKGMTSGASVRNVTGGFAHGGQVATGGDGGQRGREVLPILASNDNTIETMLNGGPSGFLRFLEKNRTEVKGVLDTDS